MLLNTLLSIAIIIIKLNIISIYWPFSIDHHVLITRSLKIGTRFDKSEKNSFIATVQSQPRNDLLEELGCEILCFIFVSC